MDHSVLSHDELKAMARLYEYIDGANIPNSCLDLSVNIATWNIRHWGRKPRMRCSLHYIAEILNQFDLIAVVELKRDITEMKYVLSLLGEYWHVVFSDYVPDAGGNKERIAFIYDSRAVQFTGLAAETDGKRIKNAVTGVYEPIFNWWRKPYLGSFKAGSFDFVALAVHMQWGTTAGREKELAEIAKWAKDFMKDEYCLDRDVLLMGDFNIPGFSSSLYKAVTQHGFEAPEALLKHEFGSNLGKKKRYDQILHNANQSGAVFTDRGGVLDFYQGDHRLLSPYKDLTKSGFTYELSDHLPLWIQLRTDNRDALLKDWLSTPAI